jgi:WD40 repeat protein
MRSEGKWRIVSFRPGDRPLHALASALIFQLELPLSRTNRLQKVRDLAAYLRSEDNALQDVVDDLLWEDDRTRLLLVADQFEELYTLCRDAQERQIFLDRLLEAANSSLNFTLVLTLRADFLGQALSYRPFADALQYADLKLGPMNREELQAAVEQPATMLGVKIESGLTERILDAVSAQAGDLPLLEFALNQLWAKQRDAQLTHAAYEEIGGVEAALARYAEEAYGRLNEEEKERARRLFIQLVRPGEGTEDTRRLATRAEVGEENWDLVTRLASARLVVSSRDEETGVETVEIVHEALIGGWERLRLWLELDRSFRTWQERLRASLRQWETSDRDEGALLRGAPLAEAEGWLQSRPVEVSPAERVFIQLSLELRDRERKEQERRRQRIVMGLVGGLGVVSILAVGAFWQWQRAQIRRINAELSNLSTSSEALFNSDNQLDALIASLTAGGQLKRTTWGVEADTRTQVVATLRQAVYGLRELQTPNLKGHTSEVTSSSFSPNGKMIASGSVDGRVEIWSIEGRRLHNLKGHSNGVSSVSFSPDGKTIASASWDGTVKLWSIEGTQLYSVKGHSHGVSSVSFSPDGKTIASASWDGTVKLWSIEGRPLHTLKGDSEGVDGDSEALYSVNFSPDGKTIASISWNTVKLWSIEGRLLHTLKGNSGYVNSVSFSPNGKTIASARWDGTVKLWSIEGRLLHTLKGHTSGVTSVSFSPDGKTIASGGIAPDSTVKLWSIEGRLLHTLKGHSRQVSSLSFSPDGKTIASASWDGTVKLWSIEGTQLYSVKGHSGYVTSVSFSPDGKTIASASGDKTVKLWSLEGRQLRTLKGHSDWVLSVSFSPDGKTIASASPDKTVKLWSLEGRQLLTLKGHSAVTSVSFSPDGKTLASASSDGIVKLWSLEGRLLHTLEAHSGDRVFNDAARSVRFSPDGKTIASVGADGTVKLWSIEGRQLHTLKGHSERVRSVSFSPDGKTLASASWDGTVKLWSLEGRQLLSLKGHSAEVVSVSFSPDGKTIASASADKTVKLWSLEGRQLHTLKGHSGTVGSVSFSPDGKTLASASSDGTVILWNFDLEDLLVHGCDWLRDYVKNNPDVTESNKHLCDGIGSQK